MKGEPDHAASPKLQEPVKTKQVLRSRAVGSEATESIGYNKFFAIIDDFCVQTGIPAEF
jgi:hypothetical protein